MMLVTIVGFLSQFIATAANQNQIAGMIRLVTVFSCISIVAGTTWKAIKSVLKFIG